MSTETIGFYRSHRLEQMSNGPFSEPFSYGAAKTLRGVFDFSPDQDTEDSGHVAQKHRKPRILVSTIPDDLAEKDEITRDETGEVFTVHYFGEDDEGIPHIWLYLKRS